jgi:HEAT repeat protein
MEQSICTLWNLSVDEKLRVKIANPDVLPLLIKSLKDEDIRVKEAAGGVLANLTLTHSNHDIMVEAGVIPKLVRVLSTFITRQFES